jgi:uncharacterized protein YuzE
LSVRIGEHVFEHVSYDEVGDVLYLRTDNRDEATSTLGTTEGHAVRLDADGKVVGITIVNARWLIERDEVIVISLPQQRIEALAKDLGVVLEHSASE